MIASKKMELTEHHEKSEVNRSEVNRLAICRLITHVYNSGYMAGHNDTVEGCFIDVLEQDMETYHEDSVSELLNELKETE